MSRPPDQVRSVVVDGDIALVDGVVVTETDPGQPRGDAYATAVAVLHAEASEIGEPVRALACDSAGRTGLVVYPDGSVEITDAADALRAEPAWHEQAVASVALDPFPISPVGSGPALPSVGPAPQRQWGSRPQRGSRRRVVAGTAAAAVALSAVAVVRLAAGEEDAGPGRAVPSAAVTAPVIVLGPGATPVSKPRVPEPDPRRAAVTATPGVLQLSFEIRATLRPVKATIEMLQPGRRPQRRVLQLRGMLTTVRMPAVAGRARWLVRVFGVAPIRGASQVAAPAVPIAPTPPPPPAPVPSEPEPVQTDEPDPIAPPTNSGGDGSESGPGSGSGSGSGGSGGSGGGVPPGPDGGDPPSVPVG